MQRVVDRLLMIRMNRFTVRSLALVPLAELDELGRSIFSTVFRAFLETLTISLINLELRLASTPWNTFLVGVLLGHTSNIKRLATIDSAVSVANMTCLKQILAVAPLCRELEYAYSADSAVQPPAKLCIREHQLVGPGVASYVHHLSFAQVGDPISFSQRFHSSFVLGLQSLELDPLSIPQITKVLQIATPGQNRISKIAISEATQAMQLKLAECRTSGKDPRSWLSELLSLCPQTRAVDLILPCCDANGRPWTLHSLPSRIAHLIVRFEAEAFPALFLAHWPEFLKQIANWLSQSRNIKSCTIVIPPACFEQSLLYRFCEMDPKTWLSEADLGDLGNEAVQSYPLECLRYDFGPLEIDDDVFEELECMQEDPDEFDEDNLPFPIAKYIEQRSSEMAMEKIMLDCRKQCRISEGILASMDIPFIFERPDFAHVEAGQMSM